MPILQMQPGPQIQAAKSPANILFFGGQAGGGKSYWILLRLAGLAFLYPGLQAVIFRRTMPELVGAGSIWEKSWEVFRPLGFTARSGPYDWRHSNGSVIEFHHLQHEKDMFDHQGREYGAVAFDEGTHFTEAQFWYLYGRARNGPLKAGTGEPLEPVVMVTANPDPDSFIKPIISWWLDADGQYADPTKAGKLRYFLRIGDSLVWADRPEDLPCDADDRPRSMTFIPSKLSDNKILEARDPTYRARLRAQLPHVRKALELGDWNSRVQSGDYFQRGWFRRWADTRLERRIARQPSPEDIVATVRAWDFAATPVDGCLVPGIARPAGFVASGRDADWTRGVKLGRFRNGDMVILDTVSARDTPGGVDALVERTAREDGPQTVIHLPQDPGQAGVDQFDRRSRELGKYARVEGRTRSKPKEFYTRAASRFTFAGKMWYVDGPWVLPFFSEIEAFPGKAHDDIVDALTDAFDYLDKVPLAYGYTSVSDGGIVSEQNDLRITGGFRRRQLL